MKRVDLIIESARYLLDNHAEIKADFHIFGDGPLRSQLEALSSSLHTESIIHFEGHCDNVVQKLKTLDALLITSDHEGLPMILLEAMALGIPIIAHAVGGIPQLLNQGSCGLLVNNHTAAAYAENILRLYDSPDLRAELAASALRRVSKDYSAVCNARAYLEQYACIRKTV